MAKFMAQRQEIADMCRYFADNGYFAGTGGNIGVRVDRKFMAVTPSASDYYTVEAKDVVILDIETLDIVEGDKTPTIEKDCMPGCSLCILTVMPAFIHISRSQALLRCCMKTCPGQGQRS